MLLTSFSSRFSRSSSRHLILLMTHNQQMAPALLVPSFSYRKMSDDENSVSKRVFDKQELKTRLTPEQYHVTQEQGTEAPWTGQYLRLKDNGMYGEYSLSLCGMCADTPFPVLDSQLVSFVVLISFLPTLNTNLVVAGLLFMTWIRPD